MHFIEKNLEHFKSLSQEEKTSKIKGILNILGDEIEALRGLKETLVSFEDSTSPEDLNQIFESILSLIQEFETQNNQ